MEGRQAIGGPRLLGGGGDTLAVNLWRGSLEPSPGRAVAATARKLSSGPFQCSSAAGRCSGRWGHPHLGAPHVSTAAPRSAAAPVSSWDSQPFPSRCLAPGLCSGGGPPLLNSVHLTPCCTLVRRNCPLAPPRGFRPGSNGLRLARPPVWRLPRAAPMCSVALMPPGHALVRPQTAGCAQAQLHLGLKVLSAVLEPWALDLGRFRPLHQGFKTAGRGCILVGLP